MARRGTLDLVPRSISKVRYRSEFQRNCDKPISQAKPSGTDHGAYTAARRPGQAF